MDVAVVVCGYICGYPLFTMGYVSMTINYLARLFESLSRSPASSSEV